MSETHPVMERVIKALDEWRPSYNGQPIEVAMTEDTRKALALEVNFVADTPPGTAETVFGEPLVIDDSLPPPGIAVRPRARVTVPDLSDYERAIVDRIEAAPAAEESLARRLAAVLDEHYLDNFGECICGGESPDELWSAHVIPSLLAVIRGDQ